MKSLAVRAAFAVICTLMLLTTNMITGTDAGKHGGDGSGIASILASGLIVSLLRDQVRRRRSLDETQQSVQSS